MLNSKRSNTNGKLANFGPVTVSIGQSPLSKLVTRRRSKNSTPSRPGRWLRFAAILSATAPSFPAWADDSVESEKPATPDGFESAPLKLGEPAPFAGTLIGPELRDELYRTADESADRVRAASRLGAQKADLRVKFEQERYSLLQDARKGDQESFQRQLERSSRHWTESPAFVIPVTTTGVLVAIAIIAAVLGASERIYAATAGP